MELLKKLTQITAPSGCEDAIHETIKKEVESYVDEIYTDPLYNLVAHKKGNGKRVMICAHADEIGVIATYVEDNGLIRFNTIGGVSAFVSLYQRVRFLNGTEGVVTNERLKDGIKTLTLDDMYIDIGATSREDALKKVSEGDYAAFVGDFYDMGENVISKAMDDRAGVYIMIEAMKRLKESPYDVYFVFTSQEEVGLRGAKGSSFDIEPEIGIAIDVTDTGDTPGCKKMAVKLGDGACIKVLDGSVLCSKSVRDQLTKVAEDRNIKVQYEVLRSGGTDAGAINLSRGGVLAGGISIPTRFIHTPSEMVNKSDLEECVKLLCAFLETEMK